MWSSGKRHRKTGQNCVSLNPFSGFFFLEFSSSFFSHLVACLQNHCVHDHMELSSVIFHVPSNIYLTERRQLPFTILLFENSILTGIFNSLKKTISNSSWKSKMMNYKWWQFWPNRLDKSIATFPSWTIFSVNFKITCDFEKKVFIFCLFLIWLLHFGLTLALSIERRASFVVKHFENHNIPN